jgi:chromosome partitioning protein
MSTDDGADVEVIGALKGGVGKTRLAMIMAFYLASRGENVLVVDGDTVSQTAAHWAKDATRKGLVMPFTVEKCPFPEIDEFLDEQRPLHDRIICDIGGGNVTVFTAALARARRLFVPIGADNSEIRQLGLTWRAARSAQVESTVGGFTGYVVLSRTDHRTKEPARARETLTSGAGGAKVYPLCDTELRFRVDYGRAYATVPTGYLDVPELLAEVGMVKDGATV